MPPLLLPAECVRIIAEKADGVVTLRAVSELTKSHRAAVADVGVVNCRRCSQLRLDSVQWARTCSFHGCSGWTCAADMTRYLAS